MTPQSTMPFISFPTEIWALIVPQLSVQDVINLLEASDGCAPICRLFQVITQFDKDPEVFKGHNLKRVSLKDYDPSKSRSFANLIEMTDFRELDLSCFDKRFAGGNNFIVFAGSHFDSDLADKAARLSELGGKPKFMLTKTEVLCLTDLIPLLVSHVCINNCNTVFANLANTDLKELPQMFHVGSLVIKSVDSLEMLTGMNLEHLSIDSLLISFYVRNDSHPSSPYKSVVLSNMNLGDTRSVTLTDVVVMENFTLQCKELNLELIDDYGPEIDVDGYRVRQGAVVRSIRAPNLQRLMIQSRNTDPTLYLGDFPKLESLHYQCEIRKAGIPWIDGFPTSLRHLSFLSRGFKALSERCSLDNLVTLKLIPTDENTTGKPVLLPNLVDLEVLESYSFRAGALPMITAPKLKRFHRPRIYGIKLRSNLDLERVFESYRCLEDLELDFGDIIHITSTLQLLSSTLKKLDISSRNLGVFTQSILVFPVLESLILYEDFDDDKMRHSQLLYLQFQAPLLKSLSYYNNSSLSSTELHIVSELPSLEHLDIRLWEVEPTVLLCEDCPSLEHIVFEGFNILKVRSFHGLPKLKSLKIIREPTYNSREPSNNFYSFYRKNYIHIRDLSEEFKILSV